MHIVLWLVQILLAGAFGMAGIMKSTQPVDVLAQNGIQWATQVPVALVRFIGISELLGAIGLILPAATRIKPVLTPLAALGILTIMILAMAFHLSRGEPQDAASQHGARRPGGVRCVGTDGESAYWSSDQTVTTISPTCFEPSHPDISALHYPSTTRT